MRRIYHHYKVWEDWRDGLYCQKLDDVSELLVIRASRLLANPSALRLAMMNVIDNWVHSAEVNLSNRSRNRQAWLGQAACCYFCGVPEDLTKAAWHRLSKAEQCAANTVADEIISEWEGRYKCLSAR